MADSTESNARTRARLAITIVSLSLLGIALVSAIALVFARDADRPEMGRLIFSSILPLLGTWVGTVLAFYFARENMSAATENTARLLGLQPDTPVTRIMIPRARMISHNLPSGTNVDAVKLADLYARMASAGVARIPILDVSDAVLYVVHRATIDLFAASLTPPAASAALTQQMQDLLGKPDFKRLVGAMAVITSSANIDDARKAMRSVADCNDVFVTASGKKTDPVVGWITNTDLAAAM